MVVLVRSREVAWLNSIGSQASDSELGMGAVVEGHPLPMTDTVVDLLVVIIDRGTGGNPFLLAMGARCMSVLAPAITNESN